MSSNPQRDEIIRRIDLAAEYQKYGGRIPPGAQPDAKGWLPVHSIDREDKHPSAALNVSGDSSVRGVYVDHAPTGKGAMSIFDVISRLPGSPWMMGGEVYKHFAAQTGVDNGGSSSTKRSRKSKGKNKIVASYDYQDAAGKRVFQVCRLEPKSFRQRRPDGSGDWIWDMSGVQLVPYHLPEILPAALVYVLEGEKDVDRVRSLGLVATCNSGGAGKWRKDFSQYLQGKVVVILPDNDLAGRVHAQDVARNLHGIAASVKIIELSGLPEKGDVSDWLNAGGTPEQLRSLVEGAPDWDPATAPPEDPQKSTAVPKECGYHYAISNSCHSLVVLVGEDVESKPLCNFTARVTDEISRDDGLRIIKEFAVTGNVAGLQLPPAKVATRDFDSMRWVRETWGASASISPARNNAAHLPNAILNHSRGLGINRQTLYTHTGWRLIDGTWRYLHGAGAIGPGAPVSVDLGENLKLYRLPEPGAAEAAQASLRFLDIGPWEIMAPLWASIYLSPFSDIMKVDFTLWLHGHTGSLKSTLAALALAHFGDFTRLKLPGSWFSTVNSLEQLTYILKDTICVIDDFNPPSNQKESHVMAEKAGRIVYQAGNGLPGGAWGQTSPLGQIITPAP